MLECRIGPGGNAVTCRGGADDIAVDVAYVVNRLYATIAKQHPEGAEEFRRNVCTLLLPDSPVWSLTDGNGVAMCVVVPAGGDGHG